MAEIKVEVIGSGTVSQYSLRGGLTIQLKAIPDSGASFVRWEKVGQLVSTSNVYSVNPYVTSGLVAVFTSINFNYNNNGTISDSKTGLMWAAFRDSRAKNLREALFLTSDLAGFSDWRLPTSNELRTISPIDELFFPQPTSGYYFSSSKKQSQGSSSYDGYELVTSAGMSDVVHAESDKEAYVRFVRREDGFSINVSLAGTGDGVVEKKLSDGFKYKNTGIEYYRRNSLIEINAIPQNGSEFKEWRGDIEGNAATQIIAMDAEKSMVAIFEKITYPLHLKIQGSGLGSVSTGTEENQHPPGSTVLLQAIPDKGSKFKQWFGDIGGTATQATIKMDGPKTVIAEFVRLYSLTVSTKGKGLIKRSELSNEYEAGSTVTLTAIPENGHRFVRWGGGANGTDLQYKLTIDNFTFVNAEFEQITYPLQLKIHGSGQGSVSTGTEENQYPAGSIVLLQAIPDKGSKFKQWVGDIDGTNSQATIKMDGPKTASAEFVPVYSLTVSTQGKGQIKRSDLANEYEAGSTVTLTAIPEEGHEFVQWHEAAFGSNPVCTVVMKSSCTVQAEFRPLPVFDLKVTHAGTGRGVVLPNKQAFWQGCEVELIAQAAEGCVFDGWGGELVEGLEETRKVTVNAHLAVTATFTRVEIPETDISVVFDGTTYGDIQNGQATVFLFTVSNHSDRQIQLDIPLAGFVTLAGEEIEQTTWVKGMIDGEKGATLRAGTFRKMGLAFDRRQLAKVALGEHLHITMLQSKPAQRQTFTFRCTNADKQVLTLVRAGIEPLAAAQENNQDSGGLAAQAELTARMQLLEKSLQEALSRLNAPPTAAPQPAAAHTQTLPEVLAWLCTQNSVPLAVLRQKLLPLGLMPSAVMDDVNERAFDVAGELALDEAGGIVNVQRGVLLQVLAVM